MKSKIIFILIGFLALSQIVYITVLKQNQTRKLDNKIVTLNKKIQQLRSRKINLGLEEKRLEGMLKSMPKAVGFKDPEKKFTEFMDYIKASDLEKMGGTVNVTERQVFKGRPVPLHESKFEFEFDFVNVQQLEKFLGYLLGQRMFPLKVQNLQIVRVPKSKPKVYIELSLLIPPRIDLPSFSRKVAERSQ